MEKSCHSLLLGSSIFLELSRIAFNAVLCAVVGYAVAWEGRTVLHSVQAIPQVWFPCVIIANIIYCGLYIFDIFSHYVCPWKWLLYVLRLKLWLIMTIFCSILTYYVTRVLVSLRSHG
ncbi:MAG: hypothetical protein LBG98_00295 [Puniceicoccales bacterium]|jgi:hypothetical protein|nr:hypothetical protein [Puniceicoccales bacterium]